MDLFLVGTGGVLGSLVRYVIYTYIYQRKKDKFPLDTIIINLSGAFLIGLLSGLVLNKYLNLFLIVGFLGAYTTFSTLMAEGINVIEKNKIVNSYIYVGISAILGVLLCFIGYHLGESVR